MRYHARDTAAEHCWPVPRPKRAILGGHVGISRSTLHWASVVSVLTSASSARADQGTPAVTTLEPAADCRCEIRLVPEAIVGAGADAHGGVTDGYFRRDSRGRYFHRNIFDLSRILVFNDKGEFVDSFGGKGEGPGEFQWIQNFFVGVGDTLHVFDQALATYSIVAPNLEYVRTVRVAPGSVRAFIELASGEALINANFRAPEQSGHPFHKLGSNRIRMSFGGIEALRNRPQLPPGVLDRTLVVETDTTFLAIHEREYAIDRWHVDGRLLARMQREPPAWWIEVSQDAVEFALNPQILDAELDTEGRLWVITSIRDRLWRQRMRAGPEAASGVRVMQSNTGNVDDLHDTVLEVLDLDAGAVLASLRMDRVLMGLAGPGRAWELVPDSFDVGQIHVHRLELVRHD